MTAGSHGLILDLDGTLVDSYRAITASLNHARAGFGREALGQDTVRTAVGHGLEHLIAHWVGADRVEPGVRLFREKYAEVFAEGTEALPRVSETLGRLSRAGYALAIASNKPARFSRAIVEQLGWSSYFSAIEGPDTVGSTKPHPAMLETCRAALGTIGERTLYVGDMPLDAISGRNADLKVVLVCGGSAEEQALRATGLPVLDSLGELPAWLSDRGWPADPDAARS